MHEGLDIRCLQRDQHGEPADPVTATAEGEVAYLNAKPSLSNYGNYLILRHRIEGMDIFSLYAHLSRILVRKGESVSQGQNIGAVGATGWATGPHLHFEYRINNVYRDPLTVARQNDTTPVSATAKPVFAQLASENRVALAAAASMHLSSVQ